MKLNKVLLIVTLAVLLLGLIALSGCSTNKVLIHPLEQTDIVMLEEGQSLTAPKAGAFLSDYYIEEVMQARVKDVR